MKKSWDEDYKTMWDRRYEENEFVYGKAPNLFFKEWLPKFEPGKVLMPADGEGRNGVYAAQLGWEVTSFDLSVSGKQKALELAKEHQVALEYHVGALDELHFEAASFDAMGLIYAHFGADKKSILHQELSTYLKPGGLVIFEAFSKSHLTYNELDPKVGGPRDVHMLFSTEEVASDFKDYEILLLEEREILLEEGLYHVGKGSVIRFVGRKK